MNRFSRIKNKINCFELVCNSQDEEQQPQATIRNS